MIFLRGFLRLAEDFCATFADFCLLAVLDKFLIIALTAMESRILKLIRRASNFAIGAHSGFEGRASLRALVSPKKWFSKRSQSQNGQDQSSGWMLRRVGRHVVLAKRLEFRANGCPRLAGPDG